MAKPDKKKAPAPGGRNPDRRNGKAWKKKRAPQPAPTADRIQRDREIKEAREARREAGMERHRQELAERAEAAARLAAEVEAELQAAGDRTLKRQKFLKSLEKKEKPKLSGLKELTVGEFLQAANSFMTIDVDAMFSDAAQTEWTV
jgi:hypothetical protein